MPGLPGGVFNQSKFEFPVSVSRRRSIQARVFWSSIDAILLNSLSSNCLRMGGIDELFYFGTRSMAIEVVLDTYCYGDLKYRIELRKKDSELFVFREKLGVDEEDSLYFEASEMEDSGLVVQASFVLDERDARKPTAFPNKPVIGQFFTGTNRTLPPLRGPYRYLIGLTLEFLSTLKFYSFSTPFLTEPSFSDQISLGAFGTNLPSTLSKIWETQENRDEIRSWLSELIPIQLENLSFPKGPDGRQYLVLHESPSQQYSAKSVSDGTLRFLAILAALYTERPSIAVFEDIEIGVHPTRIHTLVELLTSRARKKSAHQVIITTHSPLFVHYLGLESLDGAILIFRNDSGASAASPLTSLPHLQESLGSADAGALFTTGWMEMAAESMEA